MIAEHGSVVTGGTRGLEPLREAGIYALFLTASLLLYAPALGLGFLSDDWYFLRRAALHGLPELFRLRLDPADPQSYHYVPLGEALFWVEYRAFGLDARFWHAANLGLHAFNAFLVYRVGVQIGLPRTLAAGAGALFAVLFFHYESVLFVSGLYYLLASAFLLGGLLCFSAFLRHGGFLRYGGYLCAVASSLLSIEGGMVTAPLAGLLELLAGERTGIPWGRRLATAFRHQVPALVLLAAYVGLRSLAPRTSMNQVPLTKALGTLVYSLFGLLSFNVPPLYALYFAHKRAALVALVILLGVLWARTDPIARFGLAAFVVGYLPHVFLSGFETRYFYIPGIGGGIFLASFVAGLATCPAGRAAGPWALVLLTAVAGGPYRAERIREWRTAADITASTLAEACPPLSRARLPGNRVLVVDAPDSLGQLWGTSFPAYVFRNGLSEALAFCGHRPEGTLDLDFVETGTARSYTPKASRRTTEEEITQLAAGRTVLRYSTSDPREVSFRPPLH
jgi:hypothetical protein